jgi:membrane associated rhomboid family serine protease
MGSYRGWGTPSYRAYGGGGGWTFDYRPSRVVKYLLIFNAAAFVALALLGVFAPSLVALAVYLFGVVPEDVVFGFRLWQPLTYLFLHIGFGHVFWNMFGVWMFGTPIERDWGSRRFLKYYLLTGVGAGLLNVAASFVWGGDALTTPTIGASGALYGILLAFGLLYPHRPILVMFLFPIPAWVLVSIFGAIAFLSTLQGAGSGISHISHLGGMLFGLVYLRGGWLLYRGRRGLAEWKLRQAKRKFEVYMREQDEPEDRREPPRWIN